MLENRCYTVFTDILVAELIEATGCTEPIALALAGACARKYLNELPKHIDVFCSGNIIKNVKGVIVPNSGGLRGIEAAVLLGVVGGNSDDKLQVVSHVTDAEKAQLKEELNKKYVTAHLANDVPNLYIRVEAESDAHKVVVELQKKHTNVNRIEVDGEEVFNNHTDGPDANIGPDRSLLNIKDIIEFAETCSLNVIGPILKRQIKDNVSISNEGLRNDYGACVGKTLMEKGNDVYTRARARAAAGSDARMNGCPMAVVINSGSGNQGMTVSLPVYEFANELNATEEQLLRALIIANLVAVHQKKYIGPLSAYCGATSAATGAACGIAWLKGASEEIISRIIETSICSIGGMVCDGAKSSCATKVALALESALMSMDLSFKNRGFVYGEGLVKKNVEETIQAVGKMAREGMKQTDIEVLNIMLEN